MGGEASEPIELVIELGAGLRVAVGEIDAADEDAVDCRLDIARLLIVDVSRQLHSRDDRFGPSQDCHAIPCLLSAPYRTIAGLRQRLGRECLIGARVFPISERRIIVKATEKRGGINLAVSAHGLRHAHASHAIDEGAPITLVSQTLGHADLKTTSVYANARPNDSSSRYLNAIGKVK